MSSTEGIRGGAAALHYWELRQQVAASNLANATTPGFKAERVFSELVDGNRVTASAALDLRPGDLTATERPLDVALEGEGFFVVRTAAGERLSRGGAWTLDAERRLTDGNGNLLLLDGGSPVLPPGEVRVGEQGEVSVAGEVVGRLRVERPADGALLFHESGGLLRSDRGTRPAADFTVKQGYLEESNVNVLDSMVEMIEIQRSFASVQRTLTMLDGTMDTVVNRLGRLS